MNISYILKMLLAIQFLCVCIFECNARSFDIHGDIDMTNFYQITSFISDSFTILTNVQIPLINELPSVTHSLSLNSEDLNNKTSKNLLRNVLALQKSLIMFYLTHVNETKLFTDYLVLHLIALERPKCLIICLPDFSQDCNEIYLISALTHAWQKKFLDFSIIVKNFENSTTISSSLIYHYNPFNNIIYRRKFQDKEIEIFPDKLKNAYSYPFYVTSFDYSHLQLTRQMKQINKKAENYVSDNSIIEFAAKSLNLDPVNITVSYGIHATYTFLDDWKLDMSSKAMILLDTEIFFIPYYPTFDHAIVALVPIIPILDIGVFFKFLYNFAIIGFMAVILFAFSFFKNGLGKFDLVLLLLGQSIKREPEKVVHIIIIMTLMLTSFILTNEILGEILSISFHTEEVSFDTYQDLYDSQLQTFTYIPGLVHPENLEEIDNPYLLKILSRTLYQNNINICLETLKTWKNVSCIVYLFEADHKISLYLDSNEYPTMKIAKPPIANDRLFYFWFADSSPFAIKFHETFQIMKEGNLLHWPALTDHNRMVHYSKKAGVPFDQIKLEQLLTILSIGFLISIVGFIIELAMYRIIKKYNLKRYTSYAYF